MKFVLVNDGTPCKPTSCVLCGEPIGTRYLREIGTRLFYCDQDCYTGHLALSNFAEAYSVTLAPPLATRRSEAELTAK
jgi:hypothetical protein